MFLTYVIPSVVAIGQLDRIGLLAPLGEEICSMWLWKTNPKERLKYPSPFETPSWARISKWRGSFGGEWDWLGRNLWVYIYIYIYVSGRGDVNSMWLAWLQTIKSSWSPMCSYHHSITCSRASINLSQFLSYLNNSKYPSTSSPLHWSCLSIWNIFCWRPRQFFWVNCHDTAECPQPKWEDSSVLRCGHRIFLCSTRCPKKRLQGRKFSAQCILNVWTAVFWGAIWPTSCWRERNLLENSLGCQRCQLYY